MTLAVVTLAALAGCTGSGSHPETSASASTSAATSAATTRASSTGTGSDTPTASAASTTAASTTIATSTTSAASTVSDVPAASVCVEPKVLTNRSSVELVNVLTLVVPPAGSAAHHHMQASTPVRAGTKGISAPVELWRLVGARVHRTVAVAGAAVGTTDVVYPGTVRNRSQANRAYVIYRLATVYTGRFTARCGGSTKTGTYTTFSKPRIGLYPCGSAVHTPADKAAKRYCQ